jgi:enamine deaminase RidA (YjgF/YER057c/UK114 family)
MPIERIQPKGLVHLPAYTHVNKVGNTVYVAGQIALDEKGKVVGVGDPAAQAERVFENLQIALAAGGADFTHLVKLTIYALDASYRPAIAEVRKKHLGWPDPVASTFVVVAGLALPELLLEIEAVAVVDPG